MSARLSLGAAACTLALVAGTFAAPSAMASPFGVPAEPAQPVQPLVTVPSAGEVAAARYDGAAKKAMAERLEGALRQTSKDMDLVSTDAQQAWDALSEAEQNAVRYQDIAADAAEQSVRADAKVKDAKARVGQIAAAAYRSGGLNDSLATAVTADADRTLTTSHALNNLGNAKVKDLRDSEAAASLAAQWKAYSAAAEQASKEAVGKQTEAQATAQAQAVGFRDRVEATTKTQDQLFERLASLNETSVEQEKKAQEKREEAERQKELEAARAAEAAAAAEAEQARLPEERRAAQEQESSTIAGVARPADVANQNASDGAEEEAASSDDTTPELSEAERVAAQQAEAKAKAEQEAADKAEAEREASAKAAEAKEAAEKQAAAEAQAKAKAEADAAAQAEAQKQAEEEAAAKAAQEAKDRAEAEANAAQQAEAQQAAEREAKKKAAAEAQERAEQEAAAAAKVKAEREAAKKAAAEKRAAEKAAAKKAADKAAAAQKAAEKRAAEKAAAKKAAEKRAAEKAAAKKAAEKAAAKKAAAKKAAEKKAKEEAQKKKEDQKVSTGSSGGSSKEAAIAWALDIAADNSYGYIFGANGPRNYDCSSFSQRAFGKSGVSLTRTSTSQFQNAPKLVPLSQLKRGDLVFSSSNGGRSMYHVAIYMGNNQVVHARNPNAGISTTPLSWVNNLYPLAARY